MVHALCNPMRGMLRWRPMRGADLAAVQAIASALHAAHPEAPSLFAERLALAPEGCRVLAAPGDGALGYAVTHPWHAAAPPPLDSLLGALPPQPGAWHVHDIALLPGARGAGHAEGVLRMLLAGAASRGFALATLVAVDGKEAYWARRGFRPVAMQGGALASYGAGAVFMRRPLP